jgi:hypothetical protein
MQFAERDAQVHVEAGGSIIKKREETLARCLKGSKGMVIEYKFQKLPEEVVAWSDTDSCWMQANTEIEVTLGNHCVKTCSQTHETVALSSGQSASRRRPRLLWA